MQVTTNPDFDPIAVCLFWEDLAAHYAAHGSRNSTTWFHEDHIGYKAWFESAGLTYIAVTAWIACSPTEHMSGRPSTVAWREWGVSLRHSPSFNAALIDYVIEQLERKKSMQAIVAKLSASLGRLDPALVDPTVNLLDGLCATSELKIYAYLTPEFRQACTESRGDIISVWVRVGDEAQVEAVSLAETVGAPRLSAYQNAATRVSPLELPDLTR